MKRIFRQIILAACLFLCNPHLFGQTANSASNSIPGSNATGDKMISITFDPAQGFFTENLASIEYQINRHFAVGISSGNLHPNSLYPAFNPWSYPGQIFLPTIYNGFSSRLYVKHYIKETRFYENLELMYESGNVNNALYSTVDPDNDNLTDYALYNAKVTMFGVNVLFGYEFIFLNNRLVIDLFTGFGIRQRSFTETVTASCYGELSDPPNWSSSPLQDYPLGVSHPEISYITPISGFKIGFNILRKN